MMRTLIHCCESSPLLRILPLRNKGRRRRQTERKKEGKKETESRYTCRCAGMQTGATQDDDNFTFKKFKLHFSECVAKSVENRIIWNCSQRERNPQLSFWGNLQIIQIYCTHDFKGTPETRGGVGPLWLNARFFVTDRKCPFRKYVCVLPKKLVDSERFATGGNRRGMEMWKKKPGAHIFLQAAQLFSLRKRQNNTLFSRYFSRYCLLDAGACRRRKSGREEFRRLTCFPLLHA